MAKDPLKRVIDKDIRNVRFVYCDPSGVIRAKGTTGSQFAGKIDEGIGLTRAQNAVNLFEDLVSVEGMEPVGEVRIVPDLDTYTELPWVDSTASVIGDLRWPDGSEWGGCTRTVLKRAIAKAAESGIEIKAAFENEFYMAEGTRENPIPWANASCYSTAGLDRASHVMNDMIDNLTSQGYIVEQAINEYGNGQLEIVIKYTDALSAADNQLKFRDTIRGTAEVQHGLMASFSPKPYENEVGSGAHLHFSVWKGKHNLLYNKEDPTKISEFGASFIAGILEHLPALVGLTCPSYVSFERLAPHAWAGSTVAWGYDNRECTVRVASPFKGREEQSTNIELKASDASANPYLALAGLIMAGLDGVERGLVPPLPAHRDPELLSDEEKKACGVQPLPRTQLEALDLLERDQVLMDTLGDLMGRCYLASRRAENAKAQANGLAWARANTFTTY